MQANQYIFKAPTTPLLFPRPIFRESSNPSFRPLQEVLESHAETLP